MKENEREREMIDEHCFRVLHISLGTPIRRRQNMIKLSCSGLKMNTNNPIPNSLPGDLSMQTIASIICLCYCPNELRIPAVKLKSLEPGFLKLLISKS